MEILTGLLLVMLSGLGTGAIAWPMKKIRDLHFEPYFLVFMFSAILLYPWVVTLLYVPDLAGVIRQVGVRPLLLSNLLSIGWGIANVLYMISILRIGAALSGAILSSLGMSVGTMLPMVLKGSGLFNKAPDLMSKAGLFTMLGLVVVITGLLVVIAAGFGREKALHRDAGAAVPRSSGSFIKGLMLIVPAGILSCGLSLAFVYSQGGIIEAVKGQGGGEVTANFTVWALGAFGGALVNILYPAYIMTKKKTWNRFFARRDEVVYGAIIGIQFIVSIVMMGRGMVLLGVLGASIGFGIQQSMQIVGNQLVGFFWGEWKGVHGPPLRAMYIGLIIIFMAVFIFSYSNTMAG